MDDKLTPMEAEVLEMTAPGSSEPQDSYGTAPRPRRKKSHVGLWVGVGLVVIGLCTFGVAAAMLDMRIVRTEEGKLSLSMERPGEQPAVQNPLRDLKIPLDGEASDGPAGQMQTGADGISLPVAEAGTELTAAELYGLVSPGVVCVEMDTCYGRRYATGVVISSDGYILTASSGLSDVISLRVSFSDGTTASAQLIGEDTTSGVGLVAAEASGLTPLRFAQDPVLRVGETIYSVGNPYGTTMSNVFYTGMLSGTDTASLNGDEYTLIKTSADLQNAGYGCPIFDARGQVIGITSAIGTRLFSEDADPCFGISSADLARIAAGFGEQETGSGLWLGFEVEPIPVEYQYLFHYPEGIWISEVAPGTRVYGVLSPNDIILSVNGESVRTTAEFYSAVEAGASDGYAVVILYRSGMKYYAEIPVLSR